ncbi:MAG: hypothetical protein FJY85_13135 [Deltaproteobacteria bacterium]|nr:hypothetical protein [Deltaproteobacteria bacterium]
MSGNDDDFAQELLQIYRKAHSPTEIAAREERGLVLLDGYYCRGKEHAAEFAKTASDEELSEISGCYLFEEREEGGFDYTPFALLNNPSRIGRAIRDRMREDEMLIPALNPNGRYLTGPFPWEYLKGWFDYVKRLLDEHSM